jgi:hypothetical protein
MSRDLLALADLLNDLLNDEDMAELRAQLERLVGTTLPTFSLRFTATNDHIVAEVNDGTGRTTNVDLVDVLHRGLGRILEHLAGEIVLGRSLESQFLRTIRRRDP